MPAELRAVNQNIGRLSASYYLLRAFRFPAAGFHQCIFSVSRARRFAVDLQRYQRHPEFGCSKADVCFWVRNGFQLVRGE